MPAIFIEAVTILGLPHHFVILKRKQTAQIFGRLGKEFSVVAHNIAPHCVDLHK